MREKRNRNINNGVLSSAKTLAVRMALVGLIVSIIMALVGLIAGILYAVGGAIYDVLVSTKVLSSNATPGVGYGTALAFLAIIGMPIVFAIFGFAAGATGTLLYNLVAGCIDRLRRTVTSTF